MTYLYLILSLLFVFITHRLMGTEIARFVRRLGGDNKAFINLWSAVFLPGTILHEVSHFLVAAMTGVHTGKVEVLPEFIEDAIDGQEKRGVHLGYVQVAKMNPIQGFLVGFAPFITGSIMLVWLSTIIPQFLYQENYWVLSLLLYLFFTVANSMFPSWQDIKHTLIFILILIVGVVALFFLGIKFSVTPPQMVIDILLTLTRTFLLSGVLNLLIFLPFNLTGRLRG